MDDSKLSEILSLNIFIAFSLAYNNFVDELK